VYPAVSAAWLAERLADDGVAIADCCFSLADPDLGERQYRQQHLPGAHYLQLDRDLSAPLSQHGGRHPLSAPEAIAAKLAAIGVERSRTWLIAYDDSRLAFAARLWWLARYLGHERVAVLDGGWSGWLAQGYPTRSERSEARPARFNPQPGAVPIADIQAVRARAESIVLVDARAAVRYRGQQEPIDPVAGCILRQPALASDRWAPRRNPLSRWLERLVLLQSSLSALPTDKFYLCYTGA